MLIKNYIDNLNVYINIMKSYSQIYLVDDFEMANLFHKALFKKLQVGDNINVFTNPVKALTDIRLRLGESERILILLDINMPEMSGFEFLNVMASENFSCEIDVIVATSSISETDITKAKEFPQFVRDFVTKPVKIDRLRAILKPLNKAS